jgi:D-galactarolactone cycloisomerase
VSAGPLIERVWAVEVSRPLATRSGNPLRTWEQSCALLVVVETDSGEWGVGESMAGHRSAPGLRAIVEEELAPVLLGRHPGALRELVDELWRQSLLEPGGVFAAAISGVEIALWDLAGKLSGLPVYRLLGGSRSRPVPAYASGGLYGEGKTAADLASEVASYAEAGFRAVKVKVGGADLEEDRGRIGAAREVLGDGVKLAVDGCYAFTAKEALRWERALEPLGIWFFEAPVAIDDLEGLAEVRRGSRVAIAGMEFASPRSAFARMARARCVDILQPNVTVCGGLLEAAAVGALASSSHLEISFQCSTSSVALAASLHVASALDVVHSIEVHQVHRLLADEAPGIAIDERGATIRAPDRPGLGLRLDLDALRSMRLAG